MQQRRHILFVTTHNLATNPRLLKEINLAIQKQYKVTLLCFSFNNWSTEYNEKIKQGLLNRVNILEVSASRSPFLPWFLSTLFHLTSKILVKVFPHNVYLLSLSTGKQTWLISKHLKRITEKVDFVVAHSLPAFYPAYIYSLIHTTRLGIDVEDYHPGEGNNKTYNKISKQIIKKVLPNATYVSYAAPLILQNIESDILPGVIKHSLVVNNVFSKDEFLPPFKSNNSNRIKIVWFSQNIDRGRGLEEILPILKEFAGKFELTLIGNINNAFRQKYLNLGYNINIIPPLEQRELNYKLSDFDIGLAIENSNVDVNRNICLTNKICAYFQAGLYIVASDTHAQNIFLKKFSEHGCLINLYNSSKLQQDFEKIIDRWDIIFSKRIERFLNAKNYSWETESKKLLKEWEQVTQS